MARPPDTMIFAEFRSALGTIQRQQFLALVGRKAGRRRRCQVNSGVAAVRVHETAMCIVRGRWFHRPMRSSASRTEPYARCSPKGRATRRYVKPCCQRNDHLWAGSHRPSAQAGRTACVPPGRGLRCIHRPARPNAPLNSTREARLPLTGVCVPVRRLKLEVHPPGCPSLTADLSGETELARGSRDPAEADPNPRVLRRRRDQR